MPHLPPFELYAKPVADSQGATKARARVVNGTPPAFARFVVGDGTRVKVSLVLRGRGG
jgi:hypothetical protein